MRLPRKRKPAELRPRQCKYCKAKFTPARPQDKDAKFCEPNHRKAYHRYGSLPFDKLMERVRKEMKVIKIDSAAPGLSRDEVRRIVREEIAARLAQLAASA